MTRPYSTTPVFLFLFLCLWLVPDLFAQERTGKSDEDDKSNKIIDGLPGGLFGSIEPTQITVAALGKSATETVLWVDSREVATWFTPKATQPYLTSLKTPFGRAVSKQGGFGAWFRLPGISGQGLALNSPETSLRVNTERTIGKFKISEESRSVSIDVQTRFFSIKRELFRNSTLVHLIGTDLGTLMLFDTRISSKQRLAFETNSDFGLALQLDAEFEDRVWGKAGANIDSTKAAESRWPVYLDSGPKTYGLMLMTHPQNHSESLFVAKDHHLIVSPFAKGNLELKPDEVAQFRYGVFLFDGEKARKREEQNKAWEIFLARCKNLLAIEEKELLRKELLRKLLNKEITPEEFKLLLPARDK